MIGILSGMIGLIVYPISEHSFFTKGISKLYVASVPPGVFKEKKFKDVDKDGNKISKPISVTKPIRIKLIDSVSVFLASIIPCSQRCKKSFKVDKFDKIYEKIDKKMGEQLNILNIIKNQSKIEAVFK